MEIRRDYRNDIGNSENITIIIVNRKFSFYWNWLLISTQQLNKKNIYAKLGNEFNSPSFSVCNKSYEMH